MAPLSPHIYAKLPLFERLGDSVEASSQSNDLGGVGVAELRNSVGRNLEYLLNTRIHPSLAGESHTVLNYGIPDFTDITVGDDVQVRNLANAIQQAVLAFEPRLKNVWVNVLSSDTSDQEQAIRIQLDAIMNVEPLSEDVKFFLLIQNKYGKVSVHEGE